MSIDIANEAGIDVDEVGLVAVARFTLDQMRIDPLAELSVLLVDERTMTELHERWMGEPGPTDVLAFPMDELRPPHLGGNRDDPASQPGKPARRRGAVPAGRRPNRPEKAGLHPGRARAAACVHGILHLLGDDHAEPEEHAEMFGTQDQLLKAWKSEQDAPARVRPRDDAGGTRPARALDRNAFLTLRSTLRNSGARFPNILPIQR